MSVETALVATSVIYCVTHRALDHDDGRAWTACRFRQLFYFENAADEDRLTWVDDTEVDLSSSAFTDEMGKTL